MSAAPAAAAAARPGGSSLAADRAAAAASRAAGAAEAGIGDDAELESLGAVDRHDPDPVVALDRGRGGRIRVGGGAGGEEVEQPAQVPALGRLELGGEAHQLADVGEAGLAGWPHQHREVVAGRGDRGVDQLAERQRRRPRAQLAEGRGEAPSRSRSAASIRSSPPGRTAPTRRARGARPRARRGARGRPPRAAARACRARPRRRARRAIRTAAGRRAGWRSSPAARRRR